jgi:DNA-binding LacI/PurR family transcriptional regulator
MKPRSQTDTAAILGTFKPNRSEGVGAHITEFVRELIRTGTLAPGTRIPPTERLSLWWGVNARTVHAALAPLVKEHLLVRKQRCGTFVCEPGEAGLKHVALYDVRDVHAAFESEYVRVMQTAVQEVLAEAGLLAQVWMDTRARRDVPWPALKAACQQRKVDAVLAVYAGSAQEWIAKLPVPVTFLFPPRSRGLSLVESDISQQYELALRELARQGSRSVGLISCAVSEATVRSTVQEAYSRFFEVAAELNLETRESWLPSRARTGKPWGQLHEEYGYRQFKALWASGARPQGLFVDDDVVARGVVMAILECQVRVPEELKLVLYRNRETSTFCPLQASFVEVSLTDVARKSVDLVRRQLGGRRVRKTQVPARLCPAPEANAGDKASEQASRKRGTRHAGKRRS